MQACAAAGVAQPGMLAGTSSFGMSGVNAHALVAQAPNLAMPATAEKVCALRSLDEFHRAPGAPHGASRQDEGW